MRSLLKNRFSNWLHKAHNMQEKRYIQILSIPLEYNEEKCTVYQVENDVYMELDSDKVRTEFGMYSICYTLEKNNGIKYVSSGDLNNEDWFYDFIKVYIFGRN